MRTTDTCLSPDLLHRYNLKNQIVVVADILRATSSMITALAHGASRILPTESYKACKEKKLQGYITSAEKKGKKIPGFDKGNSPFEYMGNDIKKAKIAFKTTNGTRAIAKSKQASTLLIGAFLNINAITKYLIGQERNILIVCSGWRGNVNLEDTLFAGALTEQLKSHAKPYSDAPVMAQQLYQSTKNNMLKFIHHSSRGQQLNELNLYQDVEFCLTHNRYNIVPILQKDHLIPLVP